MADTYSIRDFVDILEDVRKRSFSTYSGFMAANGVVSDNSALLLDYAVYVRSSLTRVLEGLKDMDGVVKDAYRFIEETLDTTNYMEKMLSIGDANNDHALSKQNVVAYLEQNRERLLAAENRLNFVDTATQDLFVSLLDQLTNPNPNGATRSSRESDDSLVNTSEVERALYQAPLTPKQLDVVRSIAQGIRPSNIHETLGISSSSVKTHIQNAYAALDDQLQEHTTTALAAWYLKNEPMIPARRKRGILIR